MSLQNISSGKNPPDDFYTVIEIPAQSEPVKYEVDKETGTLFVDRFMATAMYYPCNYGYVPGTIAGDGDPVDVLVIAPFPLLSGSVIRCRPLGLLQMTDEKGEDAKILAVPVGKLTTIYDPLKSYRDVCESLRNSIVHFFEHYKDLEKGKWVKVDGWKDIDAARQEIMNSIARAEKQ